jgi:subtilisin family serine protease
MVPRFRTLVLLALLGVLLAAAPNGGYAQFTSQEDALPLHDYRAGELLVKFAPFSTLHAGQDNARDVLRRHGGQWAQTVDRLRVELWRVPEGRELEVAALLSALPGVDYAEPNYVAHIHLTPNDPAYTQQWAHPMISSPAAWDLTTGSATFIIAIVDTGVDLTHPEFQGRLVPGISYTSSTPNDDYGHGTHVAGIAAAEGNNGIGVAGMAWKAKIMPIKVLDASGSGSYLNIAAGIDWAAEHGAQIINLSLGGSQPSATLHRAILDAHSRGVLIVASAGNCGDANNLPDNCEGVANKPIYPAAYNEVMAVAATTSSDAIASFSNQNDYVNVAAPGQGIVSTSWRGGYASGSGTSQAAPFVSGLAALVWSMDPSLTAYDVKMIIESTAVDRGAPAYDIAFGHGRIDASAAVAGMQQLQTPILYAVENPERVGNYTVNWSPVAQADTYILEESASPVLSTPSVVYNGPASQVALTGRNPGIWYYRVRAAHLATGRLSAWSGVISVPVGLEAPVLLPINNGGQKDYRVSWESVDGAAGYRVQEAGSTDFTAATTYTSTVEYRDITAQVGGTWYYRVQAYVASGAVTSPWSNVGSVEVVPGAPASMTLSPATDPDAYVLSWSSVTGATGYRLLETAGPSGTPITRYEGTATSYHVTGQPSGHWIYSVRAYNPAGDGAPSASREITVTMPHVPVPVIAPIDNADRDRAYVVQWTGSPTATGYILEESRTPWFETPSLAYTGTLTQYTALDQPIGRWYYRIRMQVGEERSPWSASADVLVPSEVYLPLIMR